MWVYSRGELIFFVHLPWNHKQITNKNHTCKKHKTINQWEATEIWHKKWLKKSLKSQKVTDKNHVILKSLKSRSLSWEVICPSGLLAFSLLNWSQQVENFDSRNTCIDRYYMLKPWRNKRKRLPQNCLFHSRHKIVIWQRKSAEKSHDLHTSTALKVSWRRCQSMERVLSLTQNADHGGVFSRPEISKTRLPWIGRKFHCLFMSRSCSGVYQFGGGAKLRLVISLLLHYESLLPQGYKGLIVSYLLTWHGKLLIEFHFFFGE